MKYRSSKTNCDPNLFGDRLLDKLVNSSLVRRSNLFCPDASQVEYSYNALDYSKGKYKTIEEYQSNNVHPSQIPTVWEKHANHNNMRNVQFLAGNVRKMTEDEFKQLFR